MAVLARTETLRCINAFSYLLGCDIVMVCPLIHVLILLEVMNLLILTVRCANSLLSIPYSLLEQHTARTLHIGATALSSFVHVLEVVLLRHYLRLTTNHSRVNILILSGNTLVRNIGRRLAGLSNSEFEELFDVLWRDFWRRALSNLNDLALWIVV